MLRAYQHAIAMDASEMQSKFENVYNGKRIFPDGENTFIRSNQNLDTAIWLESTSMYHNVDRHDLKQHGQVLMFKLTN